jgi:predicted amidohydrolase YtcJ
VLNEMVKKVYDGGATLFVHCNGDAAMDALLEAHHDRWRPGLDPDDPRRRNDEGGEDGLERPVG